MSRSFYAARVGVEKAPVHGSRANLRNGVEVLYFRGAYILLVFVSQGDVSQGDDTRRLIMLTASVELQFALEFP